LNILVIPQAAWVLAAFTHPVTGFTKLLGLRSVAAYMQLEVT